MAILSRRQLFTLMLIDQAESLIDRQRDIEHAALKTFYPDEIHNLTITNMIYDHKTKGFVVMPKGDALLVQVIKLVHQIEI